MAKSIRPACSEPAPSRVYLVRHAETVLNAARVVQPPETPLSERGAAQAERLAARLAALDVGRIVSSDLPRARATAEAIARHTGAPIAYAPELQERDYGAIRGTPYADLRDDIFAADYEPPGGESWAVFHARVDRAWARVVVEARVGRGALAVVTHGLVCWSIVSRHVEDGGAAATMRFGNTAVTVLDGPPWRASLIDCTAHLAPTTGAEGTPA